MIISYTTNQIAVVRYGCISRIFSSEKAYDQYATYVDPLESANTSVVRGVTCSVQVDKECAYVLQDYMKKLDIPSTLWMGGISNRSPKLTQVTCIT